MSKCQYIIEGRLYNKETDLVSKILTLTAVFDLSAEIEKTENGYLIEIEADKEKLLGFEPELFKKLASLMEIRLYTKKEPKLPKKSVTNDNKPFKICARLLRQDKIIAIKGNNGFHLVCSASKSKAVRALRALISQPDKPLTIMYKDIRKARHFVLLSSKEEALLTSDTKPFVVARLRNLHRLEKAKYKHKLTPLINTLNQRITLSLPHNGLYERLFNEIEFPLVSIDANIDNYRDNLEYILESDEEIQAPNKREVLQVVYYSPQQEGKVFFGAWVELENEEGKVVQYRIVGSEEFDPHKNAISINSPMAKALIGKSVDDEIIVNTPDGIKEWFINVVQYKPFDRFNKHNKYAY